MATIAEINTLFREKLKDIYSESEIKVIAHDFLCSILKMNRSELLFHRNEEVGEKEIVRINEVINRLQQGEPFQYVLGKVYFYNVELKTDKRALIPRPETEELVDWIVQDWKNKSPKILDVGTGTGCIPLALKKALPLSEVRGIDKMEEAIALAKENKEMNQLEVQFQVADALSLTDSLEEKWEVIVSNPPYIPLKDKREMAENVLGFEPHTALFVEDESPLLFYEKIGEYAFENLAICGKLYFEIHEDLAKEVVLLLQNIGFTIVEVRKDLQGKERMVSAFL